MQLRVWNFHILRCGDIETYSYNGGAAVKLVLRIGRRSELRWGEGGIQWLVGWGEAGC